MDGVKKGDFLTSTVCFHDQGVSKYPILLKTLVRYRSPLVRVQVPPFDRAFSLCFGTHFAENDHFSEQFSHPGVRNVKNHPRVRKSHKILRVLALILVRKYRFTLFSKTDIRAPRVKISAISCGV